MNIVSALRFMNRCDRVCIGIMDKEGYSPRYMRAVNRWFDGYCRAAECVYETRKTAYAKARAKAA